MDAVKKITAERRCAGVLLPVASLPSDCGVGTFGRKAYEFVDCLADMGMKIWQLLPLNPLGYGNSPYQPFSSFAGDDLYVDIGKLEELGYVKSPRSPYAEPCAPDKIDYEKARAYKAPFLKEAFRSFCEKDAASAHFADFKKKEWVYPYAVFVALKKQNHLKCWNEWPKEQQDWILDGKYNISHLEEEIQYQMFLQYMFLCQWQELKSYANDKGISIMGDIPIYVGIDSLDVWGCRENFLLDAQGKPAFVAGVPPDYFSATGQRWGNPIYDWEYMKQSGFTFWINRLAYNSQLYDVIRIDHFRAFDTYWKIPASCETAIEGEWVEAPGYQLFDTIFKELPDIQIVVEDLGDLRPEVLKLRDYYRFMGMNVVEFTLLHKKPAEHQLIYTGTHDNQTVLGWYQSMDAKERRKVYVKLLGSGMPWESISYKMIRYMLKSPARLAIMPLMDVLELDDSARLNTPGTVGSPNWEWRLDSLEKVRACRKRMHKLLMQTGRI